MKRLRTPRYLASFAIIMVFVAALIPAKTDAQEHVLNLGLTPSQVFGLWTNINRGILRLAQEYSSNAEWLGRLDNAKPNAYKDKTPGDVLHQVALFREQLDRLLKQHGLDATGIVAVADAEKITPSVVFLNSGHLLDSVAYLLVERTPPGELITPYFKNHGLKNKTPSDVLGMVELATRRINLILTKAGA